MSTTQPPPASTPKGRSWFGRSRQTGAPGVAAGAADLSVAAAEQERFITEALVDLRHMDVREVMTPRVDVVALTIPVHPEDVAQAVRESRHSCFPVVHGDLDDIVGILYVNDLFRAGLRPGSEALARTQPLDISRRLRPPHVFPETLGVLDALAEMRRHQRGFAVVVDEYGGVAGVLTVKDLLEPLVGELHDEFDAEEEPSIVRVDNRRWLVDGGTSVDEVRERLGIDLPEGEYVTLGGYLFAGFGHIPAEGERLQVEGWDLKVVEMDKRRVAKVVARREDGDGGDGLDLGDTPPPAGGGGAGGSGNGGATPGERA